MDVTDLIARLDATFQPARFDEHDGWDFCFSAGAWERFLARTVPTFAATCNGLMLAPATSFDRIDRVYLLVFPEPALLAAVAAREQARGTPGALIITHHVTDFATRASGLTPVPDAAWATVQAANVGVYVIHAPLDCHPTISTSGALVDGLGLRRTGTFAPYHGGDAGVIGEQDAEPFAAFAIRVAALCGLPRLDASQIRHAGQPVRRVAVIAGGGDDIDSLREAAATGADTFLTGTWWTPHQSAWADTNRAALRAFLPEVRLNLLGCSHNASEQVVLRDQLAPLLGEWGVAPELIRASDHWR